MDTETAGEISVSRPRWTFGNVWLLSTLWGRQSRQERLLSNPPLTLFPSEALDQYSNLGISSYRLPQPPAFFLPGFRYTYPWLALALTLPFLFSRVYLGGPGAACHGMVFVFWQLPEAQVKTKASFCQSLYEYMIRHIPRSKDLLV